MVRGLDPGVWSGGVLLSHTLAGAVPSALEGLASGFGMGPGVPHSATTTDNTIHLSAPAAPRGHKSRPGHNKGCRTHHPPPHPGGRMLVVCSGSHSGCEQQHATTHTSVVVLWASPRPISTGRLHPSQGFHPRPINPIVSRGPYPRKGGGRPHLGTSFPLRCLQRLSLPNIANQPCPWRDNWHTRGSSVPVLSY